MIEVVFLSALILALVFYTHRYDAKPRQEIWASRAVPESRLSVTRLTSWSNRRIGLLNHASLPQAEGVLIARTRQIHTRGMLFSIDVLGLDSTGSIIALREKVSPGHFVKMGRSCADILELAAGEANRLGLKLGDQLRELIEAPSLELRP